MRLRLAALTLVLATPLHADEGMWTFDNFPSATVKERHGFAPDKAWLQHVQLSSARLARGCSGSFVSRDGLVMTNHHCAHRCIEQLSTADKDLVKNGFMAARVEDEARCPGAEINRLEETTDVTERVNKATAGLQGQAYNDKLKAEMSAIEKECARGDDQRCDVVTLYNGGRYHLYRYKRFQDVRLVFAPEFAIAFFGGDPDNFNFPRFDLDVAFLRVYENGKPARLAHWLAWNEKGLKDGDLAFVSGHPWKTSRLLTVAELEFQRDVALPERLFYYSELRGLLTQYMERGAEKARTATGRLFGVENGLKGGKGRLQALQDAAFMATKVEAERRLRQAVEKDPALKAEFGGAWDEVARAVAAYRGQRKAVWMLENGMGFQSDLFGHARNLLRHAEETARPNGERLREYADSNLPAVRQQLTSPAPVHADLEIELLTFSLTKLREVLGPDHASVKKVLGARSPREVAADAVLGSTLGDVKVREQLLTGGKAALDKSTDSMIALARLVDPDARAVRKNYEDTIESVTRRNGELIARATFKVNGTGTYPDATSTLRLSFGTVKGWEEPGAVVAPLTTVGGAFDRATGKDPYALPQSWLDARARLDPRTPFNMVTTNDIIGGNSGSPVVNRAGEVVGLVFDGNIHSLGGEYGFDPALNRTVAVHSAALTEALRKIYRADRIATELAPPRRK